jgi:hypothetical protein
MVFTRRQNSIAVWLAAEVVVWIGLHLFLALEITISFVSMGRQCILDEILREDFSAIDFKTDQVVPSFVDVF